ncbi:MAG: septum formation initiator family protein [Thermodesulfovibrionales bacterium]|jgi:cell division protein FtsB|nr:septum formation initiator family protein [Thermodesulfovibrionales bacterium]
MRGRIQPRNLGQQVAVERKKRNVVFFTVIILAFLYIGTTLLFGNMGFIKYLKLKKTKNSLETEIITLEKENKILKTQINALKEDPYYIEKHAREEFGLAKPDEYIFQFQNDSK